MSGGYKTLNNEDLHGDKRTPKYIAELIFFLVSQYTSCNSINTDIPGYKTDHSLITLQISTHNNMRGRGFWKLNTSFLKDEEYIKKIQSIITQTKDEYALDNTVDPNLLWEMIKMKIRETSIEFGRINKRKMFQKQDDIEKTIKILEEQTANIDATDCQNVWSELEKKRRELETIIEYQTKGAILRSKSRWYNEGEKNTKYFLNLEKRHCKQGTITQLKVNGKDLIQSVKEILHECEAFDKNLYCSKVQVNDDFFPPTREVLSDESKHHCEGLLSLIECLEALNGMAKEKTPGTDGLPCEFYKVFWKDIGETLTEPLNFSYQTR